MCSEMKQLLRNRLQVVFQHGLNICQAKRDWASAGPLLRRPGDATKWWRRSKVHLVSRQWNKKGPRRDANATGRYETEAISGLGPA